MLNNIKRAKLTVPDYVLIAQQKKMRCTFTSKLTLILISTICLLQVSISSVANGPRQGNITISIKNAPLPRIFALIQKQTDYTFLYEQETLKKSRPVNITVVRANLEEVLELCFKNQPLSYTIDEKVIVVRVKSGASSSHGIDLISTAPEDPIDVSGKVLNERNEPLANATVMVKGSASRSSSTNNEGEFTLQGVNSNSVLIISYVGYLTQEIRISNKSELLIQLKLDIGELGTVTVSTGYQDIPRERATGAFSSVNNKVLNQQVGTNILKRLDGVSSGVLFNVGKSGNNTSSTTNISIRGLSTINGPLDPLIVLNDFIYEGDISNINPNDIESITILKDAAATSIWGTRAGNGVIVINTKKGKFNQKLKAELNSNVIITKRPDLYYQPQMTVSDYIDFEEFLFNQGYFDDQINFAPHRALSPAVEVFLNLRNGTISTGDAASQISALKSIDSRAEYDKHFYSSAITQQYSFNLRGGSEKMSYFISSAFDKNVGSLDEKFDKLNTRIENIYKPLKNLMVNFGVYYTNSKSTSGKLPHSAFNVNGRTVPYLKFADGNGAALPVSTIYRTAYTDTAGESKLLDWRYYPLTDYLHDRSRMKLEEIVANIGLNYSILKSLELSVKYQYQRQRINAVQHSDQESFATRNTVNLFSQLDRSTGIINYIVPRGGVLSMSNQSVSSQNLRTQVSFNKGWAEHSISAIAGFEVREAIRKSDGNVFYGYIEDPLSYGDVDFLNPYPTFITGEPASIGGRPTLASLNNRFVSLYSNLSYAYKSRYILSGSFRRDGSNMFGVKTNDKWKPLWSVGVAWDISKEVLYKFTAVPNLKLRITYGYSGNVDLSRSALPVAEYGVNGTTNFPVAIITTLNNPELRWEQVGQLNFGVDFSTLNNTLSGTIEYYRKYGSDLYGTTPYDYTAWGRVDRIVKNVADMKGQGIDVVLASKNIDKQFKWMTNLLFSYNESKTSRYFDPSAERLSSLLSSGTSINPVIGKPLYSIAAFRWAGLDPAGNPQGYVDGQSSTDYTAIFNEADLKGVAGNIVYIGSATPTVFGSLINVFAWRQFSLAVNLAYRFGYYFRKPALSYDALINAGLGHSEYSQRWQQPGDELLTNVPSFMYPNDINRDHFYTVSEINVLKGDHVRLQYINFEYSIDGRGKKPQFDQVQLYLNVSNLGIIWKAADGSIDPDYPYAIPASTAFAVGLRARF